MYAVTISKGDSSLVLALSGGVAMTFLFVWWG